MLAWPVKLILRMGCRADDVIIGSGDNDFHGHRCGMNMNSQ